MKKLFLLSVIITFFTAKLFAQCDIIPLHTGMEWALQTFNDKDKQTGTINYKVTNVTTEGEFTVATVHMNMTDEKGKEQSTNDYTYKCKGNEFMMDMHNFLSEQQMSAYKDMTVTGTASYLEYPGTMHVGDALADGTMHLDILSSGTNFAAIDMNFANRKVVSQESVTVPAGTYDCYKITSDMLMKTTTMGIGMPMTFSNVDYFSPGTWFVRSENYNKSGKLMGYTVLSSFTK